MMKPAASRVIFRMTPLRITNEQQSAAFHAVLLARWHVLRSF